MKKLRTTIAVLAAFSALALPATALASSGQEGYSGPNSVVAGINSGGGDGTSSGPTTVATESAAAPVAATSTTSESGTLPFTGLDVGYMVVGGLVLLGLGFGLQRLTRRPSL